jgi:RimJ/RimL family protein N-acetyltransferase
MMIQLQPLSTADAPALARAAADPRVAATCNVPHPLPADGIQGLLDAAATGGARGIERVFTILVDGEPAGVTTLTGRARGPLALGYWLAAPCWNRGIATAAAELAVHHAFTALAAPHLIAAALPGNAASLRVLAKLGFRRAGAVRNDGRFGDKFLDHTMLVHRLDRLDHARRSSSTQRASARASAIAARWSAA